MASARVINWRSPLGFSGPWQLRQVDSSSGLTSSAKSTLSAATPDSGAQDAASPTVIRKRNSGLIAKRGATVDVALKVVNLLDECPREYSKAGGWSSHLEGLSQPSSRSSSAGQNPTVVRHPPCHRRTGMMT